MYIFGLILGREPRLVDRRGKEGLLDGNGDGATSTQYAEDSAGETGSLLTADTPLDQVPVVHLSRSGSARRPRRRSRSHAPRRDRLSLWSRLMCQPEVFDPHVEASPMSYLKEMQSEGAASMGAERYGRRDRDESGVAVVFSAAASSARTTEKGSQREEAADAAAAAAEAATTATSRTKASEYVSSVSDSDSDSDSQEPSSPVSSVEEVLVEVAEVDDEEPLDLEPVDLSVSMTGASAPKPRHAFRVTDTRKCRCRLSRALILQDTNSTANTSFATSCGMDSSSSGVGTASRSGTTGTATTTMAAAAAAHSAFPLGRLISREELAVKRVQRRQQAKEAAQRLRDYNAAWAALMDSQRGNGVSGRVRGVALHQGSLSVAAADAKDMAGKEKSKGVVAAALTNEALDLLREHVEAPAYELPDDLLVRMGRFKDAAKADDAAQSRTDTSTERGEEEEEERGTEKQRSSSGHSRSSNGQHHHSTGKGVALPSDGVVANVSTALPVMYGTALSSHEASTFVAGSVAAAARIGPTSTLQKDVASEDSRTDVESVQRISKGKYALGSRGYVEHVMFAQCRQQECALFSLLTEAHRQARAAHLRLSQVYYYYILPILAQFQAPEEVNGLVNSLLQCGTGALRAFHTKFCRTVRVTSVYDPLHGTHVAANLLQVQPVDYQLAQYRFENPWRELFHEIKSFLGMQAREDVSVETLSTYSFSEEVDTEGDGLGRAVLPRRGTVCMAATVLHSMELFERQRHTHLATRDAEDWLAWYYYYFTPQLQSAMSMEARRALIEILLPASSPSSSTEDVQLPAALTPHPLEMEYLPMVWGRACETARREAVLSHRRTLKLEAMEKAVVSLQTHRKDKHLVKDDTARAQTEIRPVGCATAATAATTNAAHDSSRAVEPVCMASENGSGMNDAETDSVTAEAEPSAEASMAIVAPFPGVSLRAAPPPSLLASDYEPPRVVSLPSSPNTARRDGYTGRIKNGFVVDSYDDVEEDEEEEIIAVDSYQTVNVGCFGLSFFSFFD